jgi:MFS family permease
MESKTFLPLSSATKFAAAVFVLYFFTLAPDIVWQDQGDYQYQAAKSVLNIPGDVVRVHPLYIVVSHIAGKITPLSWAYASNLVSAVCGALTGFFLFLIISALTGGVFAAFIGSGVYCLSHTPWFIGVQAQTYSMSMALTAGGILAAIIYYRSPDRKYLIAMGLAFGLGISTHLMSQIAFAVIMVWLFVRLCRRRQRVGDLVIVSLCWAAGAILLWITMAIEYRRSGDFTATIASAIWGRWGDAVFNFERFLYLTKQSVKFFILNFPTPLVFFAVWGVIYASKKIPQPISRLLAVMTVLYALFAVRYDVPNQNHFFLPLYMLVCVYIGLGCKYLTDRNKPRIIVISTAMLLLIPAMYPLMAHIAKANDISIGTKRHIPYRDVYTYYLEPWQHDQTGPRRLVEETLATLPPGSIIYVDSTIMSAFEYAMYVENHRQDVELMTLGDPQVKGRQSPRMFTICKEADYRPRWLEPEQLKPFAISDEEFIYEIIPIE